MLEFDIRLALHNGAYIEYPCQFPLKNQVTLVQFFGSFLGSTNASKKGTNGQVLIL